MTINQNTLNKDQLEAINNLNGSMRILAASGTGKTKVLTHRVANLIKSGVSPDEILLLTFTNIAAKEMKNRIEQLLSGSNYSTEITAGTFHSFSSKMLRQYGSSCNIDSNFTILDESKAKLNIRFVIDFYKLENPSLYNLVKSYYRIFSIHKRTGKRLEKIILSDYPELRAQLKVIYNIFNKYEEYKISKSMLDFDDLILVFLKALKSNARLRNTLHERYKYILVDEFQDTNNQQIEIIDILASKYNNLSVVGDDAQSIYNFNGADYRNILNFKNNYPRCKTIVLEQNYRSAMPILEYTNDFTKSFKQNMPKKMFSNIQSNFKPEIIHCSNDKHEASVVVSKIKELRDTISGFKLSDVAILYREQCHGRMLQNSLVKARLNYEVFNDRKFSEKRHIQNIIAHLNLLENSNDFAAWKCVLMLIPKIGNAKALQIIKSIENKGGFIPDDFKDKFNYEGLCNLYSLLIKLTKVLNITQKLTLIYNYYVDLNKDKLDDEDEQNKLKDIQTLIYISEDYISISDFLDDFALKYSEPNLSGEDAITLSTIHGAKGLEWKYVFVIKMTDCYFPRAKHIKNEDVLEEQKRLFYVAITRAKERLYITTLKWLRLVMVNKFRPVNPNMFIKSVNPIYYKNIHLAKQR